ncbi:MAG TPA: HlyU family transcriptional regulator [Devosiaceae bacterium]
MSFLKSLFGGGKAEAPAQGDKALAQEEYKGFVIKAVAMASGSEHQLAGTIEKEIGGELKSYKFVRADKFSSRDEAASLSLAKGRQLVDEQGDKLFS